MKTYTLICFFLALSLILCPLVSVEKATEVISQEFLDEPITEAEVTTEKDDTTVKVMSVSSNNITEMSLKEYLLGVVAFPLILVFVQQRHFWRVIARNNALQAL